MRTDPLALRRGERGSALIIALLVAFILSLLGMSFLLMAQTESHIAENEKFAAQARYAAEAGAVAVKNWFDRPGGSLRFPLDTQVDRSLRELIDETDPYGATTATSTAYKDGIDLDTVGGEDLFRPPYRGAIEHQFLGTETNPDLRIDEAGSAGEQAILDGLETDLLGNFPGMAGITAEFSRIDVFAPPYVLIDGEWQRFGLATVAVRVRVVRDRGEGPSTTAQQTVRFTLNEIPYATPAYGPLHSCGSIQATGQLGVRWGAMTAVGPIVLSSDLADIPESVPQLVPSGPRNRRLWTVNPTDVFDYKTAWCLGVNINDAWLRVISSGTVTGPVPDAGHVGEQQQWPLFLPDNCDDHSHIIQNQGLVSCPEYDYEFWKALATSGAHGVHYYTPVLDGTGRYQEDGRGAAEDFRSATHGRTGLFFFDTEDGLPPDGTNLADPIVLSAGDWWTRGFLFVNARSLQIDDVDCAAAACTITPEAPAEPFLGDPVVEWIDIDYSSPTALIDDEGTWQDRIPAPFTRRVNFRGILHTAGDFTASGRTTIYGSVIAGGNVTLVDGATDPELFWDASIGRDWPFAALGLPRTTVTRWRSGP